MRILFILLAVCLPAHGVELKGMFTQGGFVIGKIEEGAEAVVTYNNTNIPISYEGDFIIGLSRHAAPVGQLRVAYPNGGKVEKDLIITPRTYKTQAVKGVPKRTVNPAPEDMKQIKEDKEKILSARDVFESLPYFKTKFALPVSGTITGVYGSNRTYNGEERSWHKGLDIAAPTGTEITAPAPGRVRLALPHSFFNGNFIFLDHGHQFLTAYAHLDSIDVTEGEMVVAGQKIGTLGSTGRSTGPHLHWGLYWRDVALDPALLLEKLEIKTQAPKID